MSHRRFVGFAPPPSPPRTSSPTSLGLGTCHGQIDHFAHEDVESAVVWTRRLARTSEVRAVAKSVLCGFRTLLSMLIHVFPHFDPQTSFVSSCLLHSFRLTYSLQASSSFVILRSSQVTVVESSRERRGLESRRPGGWKPNGNLLFMGSRLDRTLNGLWRSRALQRSEVKLSRLWRTRARPVESPRLPRVPLLPARPWGLGALRLVAAPPGTHHDFIHAWVGCGILSVRDMFT